jgi:hypothetical protein
MRVLTSRVITYRSKSHEIIPLNVYEWSVSPDSCLGTNKYKKFTRCVATTIEEHCAHTRNVDVTLR